MELMDSKPQIPVLPILGVLTLMGSASVYSAFGISAYPRQEWLLEILVGAVFLIPVFNLFRGPGTFSSAVRFLGLALLLHSGWDALHWSMHPIIQTPIDPKIPALCPWIDLPLGVLLLVRGR